MSTTETEPTATTEPTTDTATPERKEIIMLRIESGEMGAVAAAMRGVHSYAEEEYPGYKLYARNAHGIVFEVFALKMDSPAESAQSSPAGPIATESPAEGKEADKK